MTESFKLIFSNQLDKKFRKLKLVCFTFQSHELKDSQILPCKESHFQCHKMFFLLLRPVEESFVRGVALMFLSARCIGDPLLACVVQCPRHNHGRRNSRAVVMRVCSQDFNKKLQRLVYCHNFYIQSLLFRFRNLHKVQAISIKG